MYENTYEIAQTALSVVYGVIVVCGVWCMVHGVIDSIECDCGVWCVVHGVIDSIGPQSHDTPMKIAYTPLFMV